MPTGEQEVHKKPQQRRSPVLSFQRFFRFPLPWVMVVFPLWLMALSLLHCKKKLVSLGIEVSDHATLIGGGAQSPLWASIVSDCLGISLSVMEYSDSSFGSAMLAGVALGVFEDVEAALAACIRKKAEVQPNMDNHKKYAALFEDYVALHDALAPFYQAREARKKENRGD